MTPYLLVLIVYLVVTRKHQGHQLSVWIQSSSSVFANGAAVKWKYQISSPAIAGKSHECTSVYERTFNWLQTHTHPRCPSVSAGVSVLLHRPVCMRSKGYWWKRRTGVHSPPRPVWTLVKGRASFKSTGKCRHKQDVGRSESSVFI